MKKVSKALALLLFAFLPAFNAVAQDNPWYQRREIVELNDSNDNLMYEVFAMDHDGGSTYYADLGTMGFGDHNVQIMLDPLFRLFIKLGDNLDEAIATMEQLVDQVKAAKGTTIEMPGYFSVGIPNTEPEMVTIITRKPFLSRYLECSLEREGYLRVATVHKSDLKSLLFSLKTYRKFHPKE